MKPNNVSKILFAALLSTSGAVAFGLDAANTPCRYIPGDADEVSGDAFDPFMALMTAEFGKGDLLPKYKSDANSMTQDGALTVAGLSQYIHDVAPFFSAEDRAKMIGLLRYKWAAAQSAWRVEGKASRPSEDGTDTEPVYPSVEDVKRVESPNCLGNVQKTDFWPMAYELADSLKGKKPSVDTNGKLPLNYDTDKSQQDGVRALLAEVRPSFFPAVNTEAQKDMNLIIAFFKERGFFSGTVTYPANDFSKVLKGVDAMVASKDKCSSTLETCIGIKAISSKDKEFLYAVAERLQFISYSANASTGKVALATARSATRTAAPVLPTNVAATKQPVVVATKLPGATDTVVAKPDAKVTKPNTTTQNTIRTKDVPKLGSDDSSTKTTDTPANTAKTKADTRETKTDTVTSATADDADKKTGATDNTPAKSPATSSTASGSAASTGGGTGSTGGDGNVPTEKGNAQAPAGANKSFADAMTKALGGGQKDNLSAGAPQSGVMGGSLKTGDAAAPAANSPEARQAELLGQTAGKVNPDELLASANMPGSPLNVAKAAPVSAALASASAPAGEAVTAAAAAQSFSFGDVSDGGGSSFSSSLGNGFSSGDSGGSGTGGGSSFWAPDNTSDFWKADDAPINAGKETFEDAFKLDDDPVTDAKQPYSLSMDSAEAVVMKYAPVSSNGIAYEKIGAMQQAPSIEDEFYNDYEGAILAANVALRKNPSDAKALLKRAQANYGLKRYDDALKDARSALEIESSSAQGYSIIAWSYFQTGEYMQSLDAATRALTIDPNYADACHARAMAEEKLGRYREMLSDLKRAVDTDKETYIEKFQNALLLYGDKAPEFLVYSDGRKAVKPESHSKSGGFPVKGALAVGAFALAGLMFAAMMKRGSAAAAKVADAEATDVPAASDTPEAEPEEGTVIFGKYRVLDLMEQGPVTTVFSGETVEGGTKVAVSMLNADLDAAQSARYMEQLSGYKGVSHNNVAALLAVAQDEGSVYSVSELVDGQSLSTRLGDGGRLTLDEVKKVFKGVCDGLSAVHAKGLINGGLQLSDVVLWGDSAKLTNAGLGAIVNRADKEHMAYVAPEAVSGAPSKASDIYSLGAVVYRSLTGMEPKVDKDGFKLASEIDKNLPLAVDVMFSRAFELNPQKRLQSADEFYAMLEKIEYERKA